MKGYPRGFKKTLLTGSALLYASGIALAPTTLALRLDWSLGWRLGAATRIGVGAAHAALAFVFMALFGALWSMHMRAGWHRNLQRTSGGIVTAGCVILAASAVGIYYLADETLSNFAALIHLSIGVVLLLPFVWHYLWHFRHRYAAPKQIVATPSEESNLRQNLR